MLGVHMLIEGMCVVTLLQQHFSTEGALVATVVEMVSTPLNHSIQSPFLLQSPFNHIANLVFYIKAYMTMY